MICSGCNRLSPVRPVGQWTDEADARLRDLGWFLWDRRAPASTHGCVLCPKCRKRFPEKERAAGPPDERTSATRGERP